MLFELSSRRVLTSASPVPNSPAKSVVFLMSPPATSPRIAVRIDAMRVTKRDATVSILRSRSMNAPSTRAFAFREAAWKPRVALDASLKPRTKPRTRFSRIRVRRFSAMSAAYSRVALKATGGYSAVHGPTPHHHHAGRGVPDRRAGSRRPDHVRSRRAGRPQGRAGDTRRLHRPYSGPHRGHSPHPVRCPGGGRRQLGAGAQAHGSGRQSPVRLSPST